MKKILVVFMVLALCIIPLKISAQSDESNQNDEGASRNKELLSVFRINLDNVYKNILTEVTSSTNDQCIIKTDDSNDIVYISNFKQIVNNQEVNVKTIDNEALKTIVKKTQD